MPIEIIIIACLAIALFLLLRHYPEAKDSGVVQQAKRIRAIFARFSRPRKVAPVQPVDMSEIEKAIVSGQEHIVAPVEIQKATDTYSDLDPILARTLCQADAALEANDLREAEDLSIEVITQNKRCGEAYIIIGKVAFSRGQFDDAKEAFAVAIKCNNELAEAYFGLGKTQLREENFTQALENLQKSINLEKGHADWYGELGKAFMEVRQYAKAAKVLKRAASLDIDNKEYKNLASEAEDKQRAHSYYSKGR
ncbi:MAG: tetratricopeptide repeat protein [Candidatus Berkelbacteria bacterium]